jgi:hypothetical protein
VEQRFDLSSSQDKGESPSITAKLDTNQINLRSEFIERLEKGGEEDGCKSTYPSILLDPLTIYRYEDEGFFEYLKKLSPAATDLEIRSMKNIDEIELYIRALTRRLLTNKDFEAVQTWISLLTKIHGDTMVTNEALMSALSSLLDVQKRESTRILELISSSLGTLSFVRDTL